MSRFHRGFAAASALFVAMTASATEQDSLIIDQRVIAIDAQVQFDSIATSRTTRTDSWNLSRIDVGLVIGIGGRGVEDRWHEWTGRYDRALEIQSVVWQMQRPRDFRKPFSIDWSAWVGLNASSLQTVRVNLLADSLIGFLPASGAEGLQQVTYERFPIGAGTGVETDTLAVPIDFQQTVSPFVMIRLSAHSDRFLASLGLGIAVGTKRQGRIQFQSPELDSTPFIEGALDRSIWQPRITWTMGWKLASPRWSVCATGLLTPLAQQNHYMGLKVVYSLASE